MDYLVIPPGPGIPEGIRIPGAELREKFARSSGPGGQGVNTTDSKVQLSLDLARVSVLTDAQRARAIRNLGSRLDGSVLTISVSTQRSQIRNRSLARTRLANLLGEALAPPPPKRRRTRPTQASVRRRQEAKKRRSELKANRRRPQL